MNLFLKQNDNDIIVDCILLKEYSNEIKILLNDVVMIENVIDDNIVIDKNDVFNGDNLKLYIKKYDSWFFAENLFVNFNNSYKIGRNDILNYLEEFDCLIGGLLNE